VVAKGKSSLVLFRQHTLTVTVLLTVVVGTSLQQNDFNKEIHKDKTYETIDNTYEDLSIEMPKAQTL